VISLFSGLESAGISPGPDVARVGVFRRGLGGGDARGAGTQRGRVGDSGEGDSGEGVLEQAGREDVTPRRRGAEGRAGGRCCQRRLSPGRSTTRDVAPAAVNSAVRIATDARARRCRGLSMPAALGTGGVAVNALARR
jgi:hypothetical protein